LDGFTDFRLVGRREGSGYGLFVGLVDVVGESVIVTGVVVSGTAVEGRCVFLEGLNVVLLLGVLEGIVVGCKFGDMVGVRVEAVGETVCTGASNGVSVLRDIDGFLVVVSVGGVVGVKL
jgi:hypothetical protein